MFVLTEDAFVELMERDARKQIQRAIMLLEFANVDQEKINGEGQTKDAFLVKCAS